MKDYIAELEKKKKKQKIWTAVFVLGFMAVSLFFLMNATKINETVFDKKIATTTEKLEKGIEQKIVIAVKDSTQKFIEEIEQKDSIISEKEHYTDQIQKVVESIKEEQATTEALIDTLQRAQQKTDLIIKEIDRIENSSGEIQTAQLKKVKSELRMVQAELKSAPVMVSKNMVVRQNAKNDYSVYIIYMSTHRRQAGQVKAKLANVDIGKFENLDKFSYNMSVRYFDDRDLSKARDIKKQLDRMLGANLELRKLNLPAPPKTIEVWLGKKE